MSLLDIHAGLTFSAIAPYIGLEPTAKHTVAAKCPYCGAHAWAIHQDSRNLEEWHYCSQCKATGSILAMAADRLGMPQHEAMQYLAERLNQTLLDSDLEIYARSKKYDSFFTMLWQAAQYNMLRPSADQLQLIQQLGWQCTHQMSPERKMAGPDQLYGVVPNKIAQTYIHHDLQSREKQIITVPFYKSPTQIGSFVCVTNRREMFVSPPCDGIYSFHAGDLGFAGLPFLWKSQSNTVVVTSMLSNMIQMQMHNFSSSDLPLPLLSWRQPLTPGPQKQWSILSGRQIVLWERGPTAALLHQAIMINASLSFVGPDITRQQAQEISGPRWRSWIHHDPSIDVWQRIVRSARPYEQALQNWARSADSLAKIKLVQDAEQYNTEVATLVRSVVSPALCTDLGRRVNVATKGQGSTSSSHGHTVVIERNGKWYNLSGNVRFPGIVRVTHLVVRPDKTKEYVGYLQAADQKIPFHVPTTKASMAWLRDFGLANGVFMQTEPFINMHRNHKTEGFDPFEAACRFEQPEVVAGLARIGWDGGGFQFRGARLADGVFQQNPEFKLPIDAPGPRQGYCRLRDEVKSALQKEGPEMEVTWAIAIALCAQVTAPVVGLQPYGIWLHRAEYDSFLQTIYNRFEIRKGSYTGWIHRWPRRLECWRTASTKDETGFFMIRASEAQITRLSDVIQIEMAEADLEPRMVTHSADKIVLNYLRHFTQHKHETPKDWETWLEYTVTQMKLTFDFVTTAAFQNSSRRVLIH